MTYLLVRFKTGLFLELFLQKPCKTCTCVTYYCEFALARRVKYLYSWAKKHVNVEGGFSSTYTSLETHQKVGARESLNGRENMAQRKSKERPEETLGSPTRTAAIVWNWSGKTLSPGALLAVLYFSSCLIFPPVRTFPHPNYLPLGLRGWHLQLIFKLSRLVKVDFC